MLGKVHVTVHPRQDYIELKGYIRLIVSHLGISMDQHIILRSISLPFTHASFIHIRKKEIKYKFQITSNDSVR
jgi:hypothetical protein